MKYVFWGSPEFAAIILEKLIEAGFAPEAVVCNPDKPVGRKKIIAPPPVKQRILNLESRIKNKIKILQPESFNSSLVSHLSSLNPDFFIVASYARIIPKEILKIPRLGTVGVHPSLLPKYRGPSPIQTAILNDEKETGATLYLMDEKIDHGPIISNEKLEMRNEDYETLMKKLAELGAELLIKLFPSMGALQLTGALEPQDESLATYTKKFKTEDAYIKPEGLEKAEKIGGEIAAKIERKIRALNPEPGVYTFIKAKRTKLLEAELDSQGKLRLKKIQIEGKKPISL
jgi:methionyl-tRNA formyltransferase